MIGSGFLWPVLLKITMSKDPAFLFYPNDYLGGTMGFTLGQHGAYLLLLICQFNQGRFTEETALNLVGETWNDIKNKFKKDENCKFYNQRLSDEQNKRVLFCQKQSKIAGIRWGKNDKPLSGKKISVMPTHDSGITRTMPFISISNSKEKNKTYTEDFERFYEAYPRKSAKAKAQESWNKQKPILETVLNSLNWQCKQDQWLKDSGQFIPMPATYLNQRRWEDQPTNIIKPIQPKKVCL